MISKERPEVPLIPFFVTNGEFEAVVQLPKRDAISRSCDDALSGGKLVISQYDHRRPVTDDTDYKTTGLIEE
jgi:hypothetical protein